MSTAPSPVSALYINGERVPEQLVLDEAEQLRTMPQFAQIADPALRQQQLVSAALAGAIDRILIRQESEKDTSPVSESDVASEIQRIKASGVCGPSANPTDLHGQAEIQARFARTVRHLVGPVRPPAHADLKAWFEEHRAEFHFPERVESAHIVKHVDQSRTESEARGQIAVAMGELDRGADFAHVARRHSDCPRDGGNIGVFARGAGLVLEYEAVIFALRPGQYSDVFRSGFGFHIAKTIAKHPARAARFEEVKGEIERRLAADTEARALRSALKRLRSTAMITSDAAFDAR